ncbi:MAG TPA: GNAT family N-acetyltransferase [Lacisediminihabitans sp.]|uniref:GNAT family N-acetyltransferase n=1 Tax=Lacisediminihabitans sp. TaxID=2787631 RepID=UPI002ED7D493
MSVDDAVAQQLLGEYFASRELGFVGSGGYRVAFPEAGRFVPPSGVFLVVESDGADVGCGGIRLIEPSETGRTRFEVKHLWLRPEARGHGHGRALLTELERRARDFGADELVLDTNSSLEAAAGLYRSSGFVGIPAYNDNPNATNWYLKAMTA